MLTEKRENGLKKISQVEEQLKNLIADLHAESSEHAEDEHMVAALNVLKKNLHAAKTNASLLVFSPTFSDFNHKK